MISPALIMRPIMLLCGESGEWKPCTKKVRMLGLCMSLRISGKNITIDDTLRSEVEARIGDCVSKYFDGGFSGHVTFVKDGFGIKTDCSVHLDTGIILQASGNAQYAGHSFEQAAERIEKRLRRYKRRLKDHHRSEPANLLDASAYIIAAPDDEEEMNDDFSPVVIAETSTAIRTMTVSMAVMDLDLSGAPIIVFRHAGHGGLNVVYRRDDGNIGWVDPELLVQKM